MSRFDMQRAVQSTCSTCEKMLTKYNEDLLITDVDKDSKSINRFTAKLFSNQLIALSLRFPDTSQLARTSLKCANTQMQ